jgi:hypothetical protein
LAARGTVLEKCGAFFHRCDGLAFQTKLKHFLGQDFTNLDDEIFELGQLGAPRRPLGSPEAIRKVLGDPLDVIADFFYFLTPFFVACHPWLPVGVAAKVGSE